MMCSFLEITVFTLSPTGTSIVTALLPVSFTVPTRPLNLRCGIPFTWVESILMTTFWLGA